MKFINRGNSIKIRRGNLKKYSWVTMRTGQTMELPEHVGINNRLEKVTEGNIGQIKVETKQFENKKEDYQINLEKINGIGKKTAKDIVKIFPTEEKLREAVLHDDEIPIRDDIELILRKEYGS